MKWCLQNEFRNEALFSRHFLASTNPKVASKNKQTNTDLIKIPADDFPDLEHYLLPEMGPHSELLNIIFKCLQNKRELLIETEFILNVFKIILFLFFSLINWFVCYRVFVSVFS